MTIPLGGFSVPTLKTENFVKHEHKFKISKQHTN